MAFWLAFAILGLLGYLCRALLVRRLRTRHRLHWEALGEPALLIDLTPRDQFRMMKLMWGRRLRELNDPVLWGLTLGLRLLTFLLLALVFASFGLPDGAG